MASTNTILIECNQQRSIETLSSNDTTNAMWTNKVSDGLVLNPGDRVSVSSAFINEVGSGDDTIQFTEDNNKATLELEFYKCADGENCLILPRKYCWKTFDDGGDEATSRPAGAVPEAANSSYKALFRREQDGSRYTLMSRQFGVGGYSETHGRPYFVRHSEEVSLELTVGYQSASNICNELTEQLHANDGVDKLGNYSTRVESKLFHTFDCANATNYASGKYHAYDLTKLNNDKWNAYKTIGMLDPELYLAGFACSDTTILRKQNDTLVTNWDYNTQVTLIKALFDAQAKRSDLIFGTVSPSNARFLHIDRTNGMTRFGSDDDLALCTGRVFVAYDDVSYGMINLNGKVTFTLVGDKFHTGINPTKTLIGRRIGFDTHFSAYGVDGLLLWSGYDDKNTVTEIQSIYVGAINPSVSFDTDESRFTLTDLHTPRKQVNTINAGNSSATESPLNPDEGKPIYQINPLYSQKNKAYRNNSYNPEVRLSKYTFQDSVVAAPSNNLLAAWTIFDSMCGVFVSNWGFDRSTWEGCLWNKLGFAYSDLHPTATDRQARHGSYYPLTTQADVNTTQVMNWTVNLYGAPQYTLQLPALFAVITIDATSTSLKASNLARQQSDGYWLIRSSLIENSMFMDSQGLSPVIAVVDKSYSSSDYIYLGDSSVDFMVTAQRTLTDITTSLHLPDGSYAGVNDRNAVVYRIVKPSVAPLSIIDSFLPQKKNPTT